MNWEDIECDKNMKKDFSSTDKAYSQIIEEFAEDHDGWAVHFLDGWDKMVQNGYSSGQLFDGPQSTWLGYDSWTKGNRNKIRSSLYRESRKLEKKTAEFWGIISGSF